MFNVRKEIILNVCIILILGLMISGCDDSNTKVESELLLTKETNETRDDTLSGTIEFVNWMIEDPSIYEGIVEGFNEEYPNIEIKITTLPFSEIRKSMIARHSAGMSADVYQLNMPWSQELVGLGVLAPLDELMAEDISFHRNELVEEPMKRIEGHTYMLPLSVMHFVLYCNVDHFEEAGLDYPTTWEEMQDVATKLTDIESDRYGFSLAMSSSGAENGPALQLYPLLYSAGGRTLIDGRPNIDSTEVVEMMTYMNAFYDSGAIRPGTLTKNGAQVIDDFSAGLTSMMIQPSDHIFSLRQRNTEVNFDVVRVPGPESNNMKATRLHGFELGISSGSVNKDLAWTFISWMMRAENNGWIAEQLGQMPANELSDTSYLQKDPLLQKTYAMMRDLELVEELMLTPNATDSWRIFTDYTQKMFLDELSPSEASELIQKDWEELFDQ